MASFVIKLGWKKNNAQCITYITSHVYHIYSKTCFIRHLCYPFHCVIRHWISFPFDQLSWGFFVHCVTKLLLIFPSACRIRQDSLYMYFFSTDKISLSIKKNSMQEKKNSEIWAMYGGTYPEKEWIKLIPLRTRC